MIPNTELSIHPMLICIGFLYVLGCFQILPDLYNLLLHLLEQLWTKNNPVHWIIPSHGCPMPPAIQSFIWTHYPKSRVSYASCHTKLHMDSSIRMLVVHCYKKTIPSVNNLPTWLSFPSQTCEACLQALG